jgi:hypothetical protein
VIGDIVKKHVGSADALNVDAMIDAYNTLHKGEFKSADEIRRSFFRDGQPLLTPKQAENVYRATQGKQRGGRDSVFNETAESIIDSVSGVQRGPALPPGAAAAAEKAWKSFQFVLRMVLPFVFVLDTVQHTPLFGQLIGAALDITAATLPVIATMIQSTTPAFVGLIPIPYAGTIGILLGWLFSAWFLWLAAVIALSRKDFAGALEATAGMIPVVGASAMKIVASADRVSTKLANRAEKIMESISHAYGSAMGAINSVRSKLPTKIPNIGELKKNMPTVAQLKQTIPPVPTAVTGAIKKLPSASDIRAKLPDVPAIPVKVTVASEKEEPKTSFAPTKTRKGGRHRNRRTRRR